MRVRPLTAGISTTKSFKWLLGPCMVMAILVAIMPDKYDLTIGIYGSAAGDAV